jgi:hypothetical protein
VANALTTRVPAAVPSVTQSCSLVELFSAKNVNAIEMSFASNFEGDVVPGRSELPGSDPLRCRDRRR